MMGARPAEEDRLRRCRSLKGGGLPPPKESSHPTSETREQSWPVTEEGKPDFSRMTAEHRRDYDRQRLKRTFG